MRVPLSWLKEFVDIDLSPEELAQKLTLAGMEVADIEYIGVDGSELPWDADKVYVGAILDVRQHPNADKLVLADVDYGQSAPHTVVTGAPNLQPYKDKGPLATPLKSVFAREGATLYDGHVEGKVKVKLKGRPVRGVMSDAMLCSEKELGISEEHEGILILPDDAPTGAPLRDYIGDAVLNIDLTPNLARALSIYGVAREVAALTGATLRAPKTDLNATGAGVDGRLHVTIDTPELCPRFTVTLIEGVTVGASPYWMQRRLAMAGMRPINAIVDITNYVMLELGAPSHAFDADRVQDQHLIVRRAYPGEQLTTLDGKQHTLTPERLVVADPGGALSLAGVMGGESSEVRDDTTRILLEAAIWHPPVIRRTAQALKLPSEASRRFERGVDYELPPLMQRRALSLMQDITGGTVAQGMIDVYSQPWHPLTLTLTTAEVRRIVGIELTATEIAELLERLGFGCDVQAEAVAVTVPSFRQDVTLVADLCEEVARLYGYDRIPVTLLNDNLPLQHGNPALEADERVRDILTGAGLDEAITYSLTSMANVALLAPEDADPARHLRLANPSTPEREYLRRSLLPSLLEALSSNMREQERALLFELGRVYLRREGATLPEEPRRLALAMAGRRVPLGWAGDDTVMDFYDIKGVVETLLERLNLRDRVRFVPLRDDARFHPGRSAALELIPAQQGGKRPQQEPAGVPLGAFGELHPTVRARYEFAASRVLIADLDLETLIASAQPVTYRPISRFPATSQDFAVIVDRDVAAGRVADALRKYAGNLLESLTLFDIYEGPQIGEGRRSLAYRLTFRATDRTLKDDEMAKVRQKIIRGLEYDVKATIRS